MPTKTIHLTAPMRLTAEYKEVIMPPPSEIPWEIIIPAAVITVVIIGGIIYFLVTRE